MAVNSMTDRVEIFKFKETGLIALCAEVVDFIRSGEFEKYDLDVTRAYYEEDDQTGDLKVVFPKDGAS